LDLDAGFTAVAGHCALRDKTPVLNTDYKKVEKGSTDESCRSKCKDDEKCSAYTWTGLDL